MLLAVLTALAAHAHPAADTLLAATPPPAIPDPAPAEIPGLGPMLETFIAWAKWTVRGAGVLGIFWCAGMMILGRRNRSATAVEGAVGLPWVVGGISVAAVAVTLVSAVF